MFVDIVWWNSEDANGAAGSGFYDEVSDFDRWPVIRNREPAGSVY